MQSVVLFYGGSSKWRQLQCWQTLAFWVIFPFNSNNDSKTNKPLLPPEIYIYIYISVQFSSVQSLSRVRLFATPWIAAHHASLSITNSRNLLKLMPIELVMPSSHLILCRLLLLLPPIPPSIRVFSNESTLLMRVFAGLVPSYPFLE